MENSPLPGVCFVGCLVDTKLAGNHCSHNVVVVVVVVFWLRAGGASCAGLMVFDGGNTTLKARLTTRAIQVSRVGRVCLKKKEPTAESPPVQRCSPHPSSTGSPPSSPGSTAAQYILSTAKSNNQKDLTTRYSLFKYYNFLLPFPPLCCL